MEPNPDQIVRDTFSHKEDAISFFQNTLPAPVIPFVFYHNKRKWKLGHSFIDHFRFDQAEAELFRQFLPNFQFQFFDLKQHDIESMNLAVFSQMLLQMLNSIDHDTLEENIYRIFAASRMMLTEENVLERLRKLIYYLYRRGNISAEKITQQLAVVSKSLEEEAMNAAEELIERGFVKGLEKGRQESMTAAEELIERGRQEAMTAVEELIERGRKEAMTVAENQVLESAQVLLLKQLERKFGSLTKQEQTIIQSCHDRARLESASLAFADGKNKDQVLAELR